MYHRHIHQQPPLSYAMQITYKLGLILLISSLTACGLIYKTDIQQGNVLDTDDIERVELGMTKRQVLLLLGSPSISDPFHQDRWDYVSSYFPRGSDQSLRQLRLNFERDELVSITGDYLDSLTVASDAAEELTGSQTELPDRGIEDLSNIPDLPTTPSDGDGSGGAN